ncbi:hypothetical protein BKA66DRAFT_37997 [Pyrenochaeta sp. MPI-SDFR-AT-0127]|nr:hypothetical protein BKA66DRAFT_37997 [Pyrenochaeta sp. MPI-SDFR-AT-0127]
MGVVKIRNASIDTVIRGWTAEMSFVAYPVAARAPFRSRAVSLASALPTWSAQVVRGCLLHPSRRLPGLPLLRPIPLRPAFANTRKMRQRPGLQQRQTPLEPILDPCTWFSLRFRALSCPACAFLPQISRLISSEGRLPSPRDLIITTNPWLTGNGNPSQLLRHWPPIEKLIFLLVRGSLPGEQQGTRVMPPDVSRKGKRKEIACGDVIDLAGTSADK